MCWWFPKLVYIPYSMDITAFVNNVSGHYKLPQDEHTIISTRAEFQLECIVQKLG